MQRSMASKNSEVVSANQSAEDLLNNIENYILIPLVSVLIIIITFGTFMLICSEFCASGAFQLNSTWLDA